MADFRRHLSGALRLGTGTAISYGCSFIRLAILARILDKSDFGVAATFTIMIAVLEASSNMSLNVLIVQSKQGDTASFQGTAHIVQMARGLIMASLLFFLAWPLSDVFNIPEARWAFQVLAVVPLMRGLIHLDINRAERELNFKPRVITDVVPQILITIAAWPMALWLKDYSALLWLLVAKAVFTAVSSHILATRPYRWHWDRSHFGEGIGFAWPLLLNGLLLMLINQGDKFATGAFYSMEHLGLYAAASALVFASGTAIAQVTNPLFMPTLSKAQDQTDLFDKHYRDIAKIMIAIAAIMGPCFILLGEEVVVLIYSEKYRAAGALVALLGVAQALRLVRVAPTQAAIAKGDTKCVLFANIFRSVGVIFVLIFAYRGMPLRWIAGAAVLGESLALIGILQIVSARHRLSPWSCYRPGMLTLSGVAFATVIVMNMPDPSDLKTNIAAAVVWIIICLLVVLRWYPEIRRATVMKLLSKTNKVS